MNSKKKENPPSSSYNPKEFFSPFSTSILFLEFSSRKILFNSSPPPCNPFFPASYTNPPNPLPPASSLSKRQRTAHHFMKHRERKLEAQRTRGRENEKRKNKYLTSPFPHYSTTPKRHLFQCSKPGVRKNPSQLKVPHSLFSKPENPSPQELRSG